MYFQTLIDQVALRLEKVQPSHSASIQAIRLFHGRGNCFPGFEHINIDYYQPVIIIQLFQEEPRIAELLELLKLADKVLNHKCV